jgi:hypothetical protein
MGCGCRGNGQRSTGRRPIISPRQPSVQGGLANQRTANQIRALEAEKAQSGNSLTKQRRDIEAKRRNAILRRKYG